LFERLRHSRFPEATQVAESSKKIRNKCVTPGSHSMCNRQRQFI
jgi:hypothetical protein